MISSISDRDIALRRMRPSGESKIGNCILSKFEDETLCPVLHMQSSIIIAQFKMYIRKFKPAFIAYNQKVQKSYISDVMQNDPKIKNSLIASIVSVMTIEEYEFYCAHKSKLNVRIIELIIKKLQGSMEYLY